jgi:hypothetical protein
MTMKKPLLAALIALSIAAEGDALRLEKIPFGDFSQWVTRDISESKVIGGNKKTVYAIGPTQHITTNAAYTPKGGTPWASSNVYAKVMGVVKGSNTVSPAKLNGNTVAKLETKIEQVKAIGIGFRIYLLGESGRAYLVDQEPLLKDGDGNGIHQTS